MIKHIKVTKYIVPDNGKIDVELAPQSPALILSSFYYADTAMYIATQHEGMAVVDTIKGSNYMKCVAKNNTTITISADRLASQCYFYVIQTY